MSFQAMAWAINQKTGGPATKAILMCLANYADDNNRCFPSQKAIAEEAEISVRTVRDGLTHLINIGLISKVHRSRMNGTRTSDLFTVNVPHKTYPAKSASGEQSSGKIRRDQRQNLPGKKEEPITYPITRDSKMDFGARLRALSETLVRN